MGNLWNNNYIEYESNGDRNKNLSVKENSNEIKPCLRDIIIDLPKSGTWKVQLTTVINFISSKDVSEEDVMHSKSDNTEFITYHNPNDVVDELFKVTYFEIPNWFRNISGRKQFYFRFSSTVVLQMSKNKFQTWANHI